MPSANALPTFEAYTGSDPFIFVSYSHKDGYQVFGDLAALRKRGYRIWYDEGIDPGNEWTDEIASALDRASLFLVFISEAAITSRNVRNEINFALTKDKPLVAVHLEDLQLPPGLELRMGGIQAIYKWRLSDEQYRRKTERALPKCFLDRRENSADEPEVPPTKPTLHEPSIKAEAVTAIISSAPSYLPAAKDDVARPGLTLELLGTSARTSTPTAAGNAARNLAVTSRFAYVVAALEGVRVFDISTTHRPRLISVIPYPADPIWFEPMGRFGILRASSAGVRIVDLTRPSDPTPIEFDNYYDCRFNNCGLALLRRDSLLVDLCWRAEVGVQFLDFADPKSVRHLGRVQFPAGTATISGDYLLLESYREPKLKPVMLGGDGIQEMDPLVLDSSKGSVIPKAIVAVNTRLYVIGERSYQKVFVTYNLEEFPNGLFDVHEQEFDKIHALFGAQMTHDGFLLSLTDNGRVNLIDISNPDKPNIAARLDGPFTAATVRGNHLYASDARDVWVYKIATV
jgi:TIR domain